MARSQPAASAITDMIKQTQKALEMNPMLGPQAERFWEAQEHILSETEAFAKHWFERRHTATRTALDTARDVTENGSSNPAAAIRAVTDWQAHSAERVAEDFREWFDLCSRCAGHMGRAEIETGGEGLKKMATSAGSTKRRKDDVPV